MNILYFFIVRKPLLILLQRGLSFRNLQILFKHFFFISITDFYLYIKTVACDTNL